MVLIDDLLQRLQSAKVYTTLDLRNGFFYLQRYTSLFLFRPFGLSNSPSVFCRHVTAISQEMMLNGTVVLYMDDMVIASWTEKEYVEKMREVFDVASSNRLKIKWSKCQFLMRKIHFLGHVIQNSSIRPSKEKTAAIEKFPIPRKSARYPEIFRINVLFPPLHSGIRTAWETTFRFTEEGLQDERRINFFSPTTENHVS